QRKGEQIARRRPMIAARKTSAVADEPDGRKEDDRNDGKATQEPAARIARPAAKPVDKGEDQTDPDGRQDEEGNKGEIFNELDRMNLTVENGAPRLKGNRGPGMLKVPKDRGSEGDERGAHS